MEYWHNLTNSKTVEDAVMERLIHTSYHMPLIGKSLRQNSAPILKKEGRAARTKK